MTALVETIVIRRASVTLTDAGSPAASWSDLITLRAAVSDVATAAEPDDAGAHDRASAVFRVHHVPGLTPADRILWAGRVYAIQSITEIGRRRWLDLTAKET
ncbi:MAG: head-tail adaptor protein [Amaricoccus sp.]